MTFIDLFSGIGNISVLEKGELNNNGINIIGIYFRFFWRKWL